MTLDKKSQFSDRNHHQGPRAAANFKGQLKIAGEAERL